MMGFEAFIFTAVLLTMNQMFCSEKAKVSSEIDDNSFKGDSESESKTRNVRD